MLNIGQQLPNGATFIAALPAPRYDNRDGKAYVILALRDLVHGAEYVTWIGAEDGTGTTWGHYYDDLAAGIRSLIERSGSAQTGMRARTVSIDGQTPADYFASH